MAYLHLHDEVADNPKVQQLPLHLFRSWINCLCIAKRYGGALPEMKDVAFILHVTEGRAETVVKQLIDANLFETVNGQIMPHDADEWGFHQTSTERVKRFRERQRNVSETLHETFQSVSGNANETKPTVSSAICISIKEKKNTYGQFEKVKLSETEYGKLIERFGEEDTKNKIRLLDEYIASKGKKYKDHYATILVWASRNGAGMLKGRLPL